MILICSQKKKRLDLKLGRIHKCFWRATTLTCLLSKVLNLTVVGKLCIGKDKKVTEKIWLLY